MSRVSTKFIIPGAVTNTVLAPMLPMSIKGNNSSGTSAPIDLSIAQVNAMLGASSTGGVPSSTIVIWTESSSGNAPTPTTEYGVFSYGFTQSLSQSINGYFQVPSTFSPRNPIKLSHRFYSPSTSGTVLLQTLTTLVRSGTDAINSVTNQRLSTNTAQTLTTANQVQVVTFDLTDQTGQINSVTVNPGDMLLITLTRGTDTSTGLVRSLVLSSNLTFS